MRKNTVFHTRKTLEKTKVFLRREKYIWDYNGVEIEAINNKMLCLLIRIVCVGTFVLSLISTFQQSFYLLRVPYYTLFIGSVVLFFAIKVKKKIFCSVSFLYMTHTLMFLFAVYGASVVVPDTKSTLIIGFAFVFCLTVFDKIIRVNLMMTLFLVNYILFVTPIKTPNIAFMDAITVIGFSIVAMVLGSYLRQLQLENIDLKRQAKLREATDALTGLLSRAKLLKIAEEHHVVDKIAAVIMMDIDYFKAYNDTYGHQQGDHCLRSVSNLFLQMSNDQDISFFRYGGEEFVGIVWDSETDSLAICQGLVRQVGGLNIVHERSPFKHVTLSIGCSIVAGEQPKTFEKMIAQADQALYQSKDAGRNQVNLYHHTV